MSYAAPDSRMQEQRPSALALCAGCALALGDDVRLYLGDCLDIMPLLTGIDSVISENGRVPNGLLACPPGWPLRKCSACWPRNYASACAPASALPSSIGLSFSQAQ